MSKKQIELLQKLKVLADRGVGGEKENSEELLQKLMKKYNISEEEIEANNRSYRDFRYKNEHEEKLIRQVIYSVNPNIKKGKYNGRARKIVVAEVTESEYIEIEYLYSIYKNAYYKELDLFYMAFIHKNSIFPVDEVVTSEEQERKRSKYSNLEQEKIINYMNTIDKSNVRKSIGEGSDE